MRWAVARVTALTLFRPSISYAEGLAIVKSFLSYASTHSVAELQSFTGHKVPTPKWQLKEVVHLPSDVIDRAAEVVRKQLRADSATMELVGGERWWTARGRELMCEWIEMKEQKLARKGKPADRILFYIHGGQSFLSSPSASVALNLPLRRPLLLISSYTQVSSGAPRPQAERPRFRCKLRPGPGALSHSN